MDQQERINAIANPETRRILQDAYDALCDAIVVDCDSLPERYRQRKEFDGMKVNDNFELVKVYTRPLSELNHIYDKQVSPKIQKANDKREREERLARYAQQMDESGQIEYEVNETRLEAAQFAYVSMAVRAGVMDV